MQKRPRRRPAWTANQIVAYNVAQARLRRGWTQSEAAAVLAPFLGQRLSPASFSALERSVDGGRVRQFTADDLLAMSRAFELPIGWFLTPPPREDGVDVATPDHPDGVDPDVMLDAVLGTEDTLATWRDMLRIWPSMRHRGRMHPDGSVEHLGRVDLDVHGRVEEFTTLRAMMAVRSKFGDIDAAIDALGRVQDLLCGLDGTSPRADADEPGDAP